MPNVVLEDSRIQMTLPDEFGTTFDEAETALKSFKEFVRFPE